MTSTSRPHTTNRVRIRSKERTCFEQRRDALVGELTIVSAACEIWQSLSLEQVLQNINKLNRSLEGIIAVGNEFGSVEALWSQFENVMAKDPITDNEEKENVEVRDDEVFSLEGQSDPDMEGDMQGKS